MGKWDKYVVPDSVASKWSKYAVDDTQPEQKQQWQQSNTNPYNNSLIGRENKVANAVLNPFSTIAKSVGANPEVGSMMDKFSPIPAIAKGVEKFASIPSAPDWQTGASRLGSGMTDVGMGALQTLNPVPFGAFGAGQEALGMVSPNAANVLQKVTNPVTSLSNPQTEIGQNAASAADLALQGLALQYGGKVKQAVGRGLENTASGMAGKAFHVGENFKDTRQLGKFAQERGYVVGKEGAGTISPFKGLSSAEKLQQTLNSEINSKIIDPATKAGVLIDGQSYVNALGELRNKLASDAVPDQTSLNAIDKMIDAANERLTRTEVQGMLTPREAQDMKVTGNKILSTVYSKKAQGAVYDEEIASKKRGRLAVTDELRTQLEQIHPELKNLNWNQGAVIDIMTSMQDYLNRKARGEGESNVSGYVSTALKLRLGIRDALMIDPVLSRMAVMLGKVGRGLSGNEPNNVSGVSFPFSASRWNPPAPPPPSGLTLPPQPPVFGSPRNPQAKPFTPFSQAVDAEWSVENPMQPQQPKNLIGSGVRINKSKNTVFPNDANVGKVAETYNNILSSPDRMKAATDLDKRGSIEKGLQNSGFKRISLSNIKTALESEIQIPLNVKEHSSGSFYTKDIGYGNMEVYPLIHENYSDFTKTHPLSLFYNVPKSGGSNYVLRVIKPAVLGQDGLVKSKGVLEFSGDNR